MSDRIQLGDKVRDRISGYEGICMGKCSYLTGCDQVGIKPQGTKPDGGTRDTLWFDEPFVEVIETQVVQPVVPRRTDSGGPSAPMIQG